MGTLHCSITQGPTMPMVKNVRPVTHGTLIREEIDGKIICAQGENFHKEFMVRDEE